MGNAQLIEFADGTQAKRIEVHKKAFWTKQTDYIDMKILKSRERASPALDDLTEE